MLLTNQISCIRHETWLWRVLVQFLALFSWIKDVMASGLWVRGVPRGVCGQTRFLRWRVVLEVKCCNTMTTSSIHSMLTMGFKYKSRSLERLLTFSAIQSSSFWGMFKWRICVHMVSEVVRGKLNLSRRRKEIVYVNLDFWAIWMHRHYWIQWYGCVLHILHYAVGGASEPLSWPVEPLVSYLLYTEDASQNNPGGLEDSPETSNVHYANANHPDQCFIRLYRLNFTSR